MSMLILALDAGTTATKAAAFDEAGRIVAAAEERTRVRSTEPGRREIDMAELAESTFSVMRKVVDRIDAASVAGIAITGQGEGAWLIDADGRPVRAAVLWNDARAAATHAQMRAAGEIDRIRHTTGGSVHPGSLPVIARWLHEHETDVFDRTAFVLSCKDWIRLQLTSVVETEASDLSRSYMNTATGEIDEDLVLSLGDVPLRAIAPVADASETRPLSTAAAHLLGLPVGLPVGIGTMDVASVGYAFAGDAVERAWAIIGTTSFIGVVRDEMRPAGGGNWMAQGTRGLSINSLAPMVGAPLLEWVKAFIGCGPLGWEAFEYHARSAANSRTAPLLLPYLAPSGERAPFMDPFARGSLHGLSYDTTGADLAWAAYAGLAQTLAECVQQLDVHGPIQIAGGGSASDLLCQLVADYSGHVIERPLLAAEIGMVGAVRRVRAALGHPDVLENAAIESVQFCPTTDEDDRLAAFGALQRHRVVEQPLWNTDAVAR